MSYITVSEADSFLRFHDWSEEWNQLSSEEKEYLLNYATSQIDSYRVFIVGVKLDENQTYEFPRRGQDTVPSEIKIATAELAIFKAINKQNKQHRLAQENGLQSVGMLGISFGYAGGYSDIPKSVERLLMPFLSFTGCVF
ncbi:hypothetical protein QYF48_16200 [Brevibacillus agri]|uniref:DnaT-like ssDNA-binding protein n=1 Tax=Brevibacillus agri TaxID=51101 RepID=UPI0025B72A08|nr:DnaT-like ssDNA-binding protein [Brevibacillus agri]MDN4094351.1 hypothetical protein [Brevibacillus agri]